MIAMCVNLPIGADEWKKARADSLDSIDVDSSCATTTPEISDEDSSSTDSDEYDNTESIDAAENFDDGSFRIPLNAEGGEVGVAATYRDSQESVTFFSSLPSYLSTIYEAIDEDEDDADHRSEDLFLPLKVVPSSLLSSGRRVKCRRSPTIHDEPLKKRPLFLNNLPASFDELEPITIEVISSNEDSFSDFLQRLIDEELKSRNPCVDPVRPMKVVASPMVSDGRKTKFRKAPTFSDEPLWKRPLLPYPVEGPLDPLEPWSLNVSMIAHNGHHH